MRTRNGSTTDSIVSASSPTETARVLSPTGPPPNRVEDGLQHGAVEPVEAERVDVVEVERGARRHRYPRLAAVHERVVAHAAQQAVRDARACRGSARRSRRARRAVDSTPSMRGGALEHLLELCLVVELEVRGEAEAVAQRVGQQAGARRGARRG